MKHESLRDLATRRGLWIGCAVEPAQLHDDPACREIVTREFNCITAENCMKFDALQPERGVFTFDVADRLLDFAAEHGMAVRGHTLVWHNALPAWLKERPLGRAEALDILQQHIETVVTHFKGRLPWWDVVNEVIDDGFPGYRLKHNLWYRAIGEDYLELAFRWAHAADPASLLFYNDYDLQSGEQKFGRTLEMIRMLQARHAPLHGLGFQFHTMPPDAPSQEAFLARLQRVRDDLGLVAHLTEIDINLSAALDPGELEQQAEVYRSILAAAMASGNCPVFITWGVCDKYTWVRRFTEGRRDHPLLFDKNYQAKPAYYALCDLLRSQAG